MALPPGKPLTSTAGDVAIPTMRAVPRSRSAGGGSDEQPEPSAHSIAAITPTGTRPGVHHDAVGKLESWLVRLRMFMLVLPWLAAVLARSHRGTDTRITDG